MSIRVNGAELPASLAMPSGRVRAGVVVLHGADAGERSFFLYEHLADLLKAEGVAVLRYDRRPSADGHDVPLQIQAADALTAVRQLREVVGAPVGLWGFSQGAWAAPMAAVTEPDTVAFLICVSCCGVTPALQMRVGCSKQLRKHGFDGIAVVEASAARRAFEHFLRTGEGRSVAQAHLDRAATHPWFRHAYLPRTLPGPGAWADMDYDPSPVLSRLTCPVLAFYGETDEWMPIEESVEAWNAAKELGALTDLTVVRLDGADHLPTSGGRPERAAISTVYSQRITLWL